MAKLTTIIPTYRRPQFLKQAVRCVQNQTFDDLIIYIFDNASEDETEEVVRELQKEDRRIKYYCPPKNIGLLRCFEAAQQGIETPFFHYYCDDDYILPSLYETAFEGFKKYPESGMSICRTLVVNKNFRLAPKQLINPVLEGYFQPPEGLYHLIKYQKPPLWQGIVYRKEVLEAVGGLNIGVGTLFDVEFTLKAAARFPFVANKQLGAFFFLWDESCSGQITKPPWPNYTQLMQNLLKEPNLNGFYREKIRKKLQDCRTIGQRGIWTAALTQRDLQSLRLFKNTLCEQGDVVEAKLISKLLWICDNVPLASYFLQLLLNALKLCRKCYLNSLAKEKELEEDIVSMREKVMMK